MSRVGLVTLHESDNYGTCLQAFTLQKAIEYLGYECEIIRFYRNSEKKNESKLKTLLSLKPTKTIDIVLSRSYVCARKKKFNNFREKYLNYSSESYFDLCELYNNPPTYDAYVTGSDMVWSWESRKYLDYFFLKFVKDNKTISYAPSFGNTAFTDEMKEYYNNAIRNISYCSCREMKGKEYIEHTLNKECVLAVDPTILVDISTWTELIDLDRKKQLNALVYMFGDIPRSYYRVLETLKSTGYQIRYIPQCYKQHKNELKNGVDSFGPIEFLQYFHDADFVITNTYHGLMFSLIFEKPFVMLHRPEREHWALHEERMQSVLDMFDLSDRYIFFNDEIKKSYLNLDYSIIRPKMQEEILNSYDFLKRSLRSALGE